MGCGQIQHYDFLDLEGAVLYAHEHFLPDIVRAIPQAPAPTNGQIVIAGIQSDRQLLAAGSLRQPARGGIRLQICHSRRADDLHIRRFQGLLIAQSELKTFRVLQFECGAGQLVPHAPEPESSLANAPCTPDHIVLQDKFVLSDPALSITRRESRKKQARLRPPVNRQRQHDQNRDVEKRAVLHSSFHPSFLSEYGSCQVLSNGTNNSILLSLRMWKILIGVRINR